MSGRQLSEPRVRALGQPSCQPVTKMSQKTGLGSRPRSMMLRQSYWGFKVGSLVGVDVIDGCSRVQSSRCMLACPVPPSQQCRSTGPFHDNHRASASSYNLWAAVGPRHGSTTLPWQQPRHVPGSGSSGRAGFLPRTMISMVLRNLGKSD